MSQGVHRADTALHFAARFGHSDIAERICIIHKVLAEEDHLSWVNALDMYAACALSFSHTLNLRPVRVVIAPTRHQSTPLMMAAHCGHLETVRALLRHGATVNDGLLDTISRIVQGVIPDVSNWPRDTRRMDFLRLCENFDDVSLALRQRYDADK